MGKGLAIKKGRKMNRRDLKIKLLFCLISLCTNSFLCADALEALASSFHAIAQVKQKPGLPPRTKKEVTPEIKISQDQEKIIKELEQKIEELKQQIKGLEEQPIKIKGLEEQPIKKLEQIKELEQKIEKLKKQIEELKKQQIKELEQPIKKLEQQIKELEQQIKELKIKKEIEELEQQIKDLTAEKENKELQQKDIVNQISKINASLKNLEKDDPNSTKIYEIKNSLREAEKKQKQLPEEIIALNNQLEATIKKKGILESQIETIRSNKEEKEREKKELPLKKAILEAENQAELVKAFTNFDKEFGESLKENDQFQELLLNDKDFRSILIQYPDILKKFKDKDVIGRLVGDSTKKETFLKELKQAIQNRNISLFLIKVKNNQGFPFKDETEDETEDE